MSKRRYDPEAARQDILDAAERLFADRGYGDVSTALIARHAGVSQSQIHYHYATKRKLWETVFHRRFAEYFGVQSSLLSRDDLEGTERIRASIEAYFRFFQQNPRFVKLLARAHLDSDYEEEPMSALLLSTGAKVIAQAQQAGHVRDDVEPEFVLVGFLSLVAYWFQCRSHYLPGMGLSRAPESYDEAYLEFLFKIYLRGIEPVAAS